MRDEPRVIEIDIRKEKMSNDLIDLNAKAARQGIEGHEKRIVDLENELLTIRRQQQTLIDMVTKLQNANNLALQKVRGTGATSTS